MKLIKIVVEIEGTVYEHFCKASAQAWFKLMMMNTKLLEIK